MNHFSFLLIPVKNLNKKVCLFILVLCTGFSVQTFSQTQEELQNKKSELQNQINSLQQELDQTKKNKKVNLAELTTLQQKINSRQKLISNYNNELNLINADIIQTVSSIKQLDNDLTKLKNNYAEMVYYAYKHRSSYDKLVFLFSSKDFNDALTRMHYIKRYSGYRKSQAALIKQSQIELKEKLATLAQQRSSKKEVLSSQQDEKEKLDKEKLDKSKMVKELGKQEKTLKANLDKKKKESDKLNKQISDLIKKEIESQNKKTTKPGVNNNNANNTSVPSNTPEVNELSAGFANNMGKLPWPVEKGDVIEQFGVHPHPFLKNVTTKNNGVDIKTTIGASVRTIYKGTVVSVFSNPAYHKAVLVKHGEYFTVYANLVDVNVKAGQELDTKTKVGTAYSDAETGITMVHLEIWKGTTLLNPESWLATH